MEAILQPILDSGRSAVELALFILLPVMVVMMAIMEFLEVKGVLQRVARFLSPLLKCVKVPGEGAFAILQMQLVSFAAPVATLSQMERQGIATRSLVATLAMLLCLSQANVTFPLAVVGLDLRWVFFTSLLGGITASLLAWKLWAKLGPEESGTAWGGSEADHPRDKRADRGPDRSWLQALMSGGWEGVLLAVRAIPILVLALLLVTTLRNVGAIAILERVLDPVFGRLGIPDAAVLALATKYLAGGTAFTGVAIRLVQEGAMTAEELNRIAGLAINPLDLVGVSVLASAGSRSASAVRVAVLAAIAGIAVRAVIHLLVF